MATSPHKDKPSPMEGEKSPVMATFLIPSPIVTRRTRTSSIIEVLGEKTSCVFLRVTAQIFRCTGRGHLTSSYSWCQSVICAYFKKWQRERSRLASEAPLKKGTIARFDRCKGHGFITPCEEGAPEIFCHISDIEGEIIPMTGDLVTYKECPIPPKKTKIQAAEVNIVNLAPGRHKTWEDPLK